MDVYKVTLGSILTEALPTDQISKKERKDNALYFNMK